VDVCCDNMRPDTPSRGLKQIGMLRQPARPRPTPAAGRPRAGGAGAVHRLDARRNACLERGERAASPADRSAPS